MDKRLLQPGWAGKPEESELEFLTIRLARDQRLAARWGFTITKVEQPDWAILQVAMWGDPARKELNAALAGRQINASTGSQISLF